MEDSINTLLIIYIAMMIPIALTLVHIIMKNRNRRLPRNQKDN